MLRTMRVLPLMAVCLLLSLGCRFLLGSPTPARPGPPAVITVPVVTAPTLSAPVVTAPVVTPPDLPLPTAASALTPQASPTAAEVQIFLVALEDNGQSGLKIGCNDSLVAVPRPLPPGESPLQAAYQALFAIDSQQVGESGLYNALYNADLTFLRSEELPDGSLRVDLEGEFSLGGTCDSPRFQAQLEEIARPFSRSGAVAVFINAVPLQELLSER